jgi:hypothetical protein
MNLTEGRFLVLYLGIWLWSLQNFLRVVKFRRSIQVPIVKPSGTGSTKQGRVRNKDFFFKIIHWYSFNLGETFLNSRQTVRNAFASCCVFFVLIYIADHCAFVSDDFALSSLEHANTSYMAAERLSAAIVFMNTSPHLHLNNARQLPSFSWTQALIFISSSQQCNSGWGVNGLDSWALSLSSAPSFTGNSSTCCGSRDI